MTKLQVKLPERLAREAQSAGLLESRAIERLIRAEIRRRRVNQLFKAADRLAALDLPAMTNTEVNAEIRATRTTRRTRAHRR